MKLTGCTHGCGLVGGLGMGGQGAVECVCNGLKRWGVNKGYIKYIDI